MAASDKYKEEKVQEVHLMVLQKLKEKLQYSDRDANETSMDLVRYAMELVEEVRIQGHPLPGGKKTEIVINALRDLVDQEAVANKVSHVLHAMLSVDALKPLIALICRAAKGDININVDGLTKGLRRLKEGCCSCCR